MLRSTAQPVDARVPAEPRVLTAGESLGGAHGLGPRLVLGALLGQRGEHLLVAERPGRGPSLAQALCLQGAHLVHEPGRPHPVDPQGDAFVEFGTGHVDADLDGVVHRIVTREVGGEGLAGDLDDFEGPDDPAAVAGQDGPARLGVGGGQPGVQRAGAVLGQLRLQRGPYVGVRAGELQGVDGALHIEPGAADQDGRAAGGEQPVDLGAGQPLVLGDAGGLRDVPDVQQVVRDGSAFGERQLRGADVHAPVELHGVGIDHLAVELLSKEYPQIGFSGRSGADDGDDPRCGSRASHRHSLANLRTTSRTNEPAPSDQGETESPATPSTAVRTGRIVSRASRIPIEYGRFFMV